MLQFAKGVGGHIAILRKAAVINDNASMLDTTVQYLRTQVDEVSAELKADGEDLIQMRAILARVRLVRQSLEQRLRVNKRAADTFDEHIGPLASVYDAEVAASALLYGAAKEKHAKGIAVLEKSFDYHPLFAKGDGKAQFRGTPFKPK